MKYQLELEYFREQLGNHAEPDRAQGAKSYLKSNRDFYGVKVPELRRLAKAWLKANKCSRMDDIAAVALLLWESPSHEERSLAAMLLEYRSADLSLDQMPLIERMLDEATTWAVLDALAVWVVGAMIDQYPEVLSYLPKWAKSDNFWVRRAAILVQIPQFRRGEGDFDLFTRLAVPMFDEGADWSKDERFFIRKSIGWTLRELADARPELVLDFVMQYRDQMSGLTFREATRKLPDEYKSKL